MKSVKTNSAQSHAPDVCGIILCAGQGTRTGLGYNKVLHYLGQKTVLERTIEPFKQSRVNRLVLVISPSDETTVIKLTANYADKITLVHGGMTRTQSVRNGLLAAKGCDVVVIHDGARPFITPHMIDQSVESALEYGSGIAAVPTIDTIKQVQNGEVVRTLARADLFNVQTPQAFLYDLITKAYARVEGDFNDDSEVFERAGYRARIVSGDYRNKKVTAAADLYQAVAPNVKIGIGFDVHPLVKNRPLILGGETILYDMGLNGHSDADVLTHAIMDALLSAAAFPDIGVIFPDTDAQYKDADSIALLETVVSKVAERHYRIGNVSAVVMAQKPRLSPFMPQIIQRLAQAMNITPECVNVSATTTEELGIVGEGKGIAASASCLLFV